MKIDESASTKILDAIEPMSDERVKYYHDLIDDLRAEVKRLKEDPYKLSEANEQLRERLKELESEFGDWRNKLLKENGQLKAKLAAHEEAMSEIMKGEGRFSRDPLTHASNTIEDMKEIARAMLEAE